jgi:hypothetical protein
MFNQLPEQHSDAAGEGWSHTLRWIRSETAKMIDVASHRAAPRTADYSRGHALLLGLAIFVLLWILSIPYRAVYVPNELDIPVLADGLLLVPGAHWQDWFTRGYSDYWAGYPEWPQRDTGFTRPAFQFVIYLAHFALGRAWASYQVINCFAAASLAAVAFQIAKTALGLRTGPSLLAAILVLLSPPVLQSWVFGVAYAHEPLTALLVACAFLAVVARRDFLCLMFLFAALLTKENAVWAPLAAAMTVMLRANDGNPVQRRYFVAAAMFVPIAMWLCIRFAFFGGIGGTYATAGYASLKLFLHLTFYKLKHIYFLFVNHYYLVTEGRWALLDRAIMIATILLVYALLSLWALRIVPETVNRLRYAIHETRWPTVDATFLVGLWAAIALAFHFALPLVEEKYATSVPVFAWPALVAEVEVRRRTLIWLGLAVFSVVALARSSYYTTVEWTPKASRNDFKAMNAVLHDVPTATRQIYVLPDRGLPYAYPEYVRHVLDVSAEIVRVVDINWQCEESSDLVAFDYSTADGIVGLTVTLPDCANFRFDSADFGDTRLANGRLYRNPAMNYELPEASEPPYYLGRKMIVHVRPNGPARFIIEHGGPNGISWFDTP